MFNASGGRGHSALPPGRTNMFETLSKFATLFTILVIGYFVLTLLGKFGWWIRLAHKVWRGR